MKNYDKIAALDFEMFNTKHYWSVCWAGLIEADINLNAISVLDEIINPMIKDKFIGPVMTLPFNYLQLKDKPTFPFIADRLFSALDGALVIGHALENDLRMISEVCKKFSLLPPNFDYIDTNICYCAFSGTTNEQSLTRLAELFNIKFDAHNPVEDARAALDIIKAMADGDLNGFLKKFNIVPGRYNNGIVRRSYRDGMGINQASRLHNYNRVFDAAAAVAEQACSPSAASEASAVGEAYFFINSLAMEQDLFEIAAAVCRAGDRLAVDTYCADYTVSNDLYFAEPPFKTILLKQLATKFKLNLSKYNFTPKRVTLKDGSVMSYRQYSSMVKKGLIKNGEVVV